MSVLQRKAQVGRQEHQARAMTVPKSLRVALAKVADKSFNMALAVIGITQEICSNDEIAANLAEDGLLVLLDGPNGMTGGAVLDAALVTALVQQQTTGRVSKTPSAARPMTQTDAALCAPVLDALFIQANGLLDTPEERDILPCFKFGARAENLRLFGLALDAPDYRILKLTIDIAAGVAQSTMMLVLPAVAEKPVAVHEPNGEQAQRKKVTLEKSVMGLKADLSAVLCRKRMSLSAIRQLQPGDVLSLPSEAFDSVELISIDGRLIGKGSMGQIDGNRALMMQADGATAKKGQRILEGSAVEVEESSDYGNLDLPELDLPAGPEPYMPSADGSLPDLPDLPDIPDFDNGDDISMEDMELSPDLPDLPDLPDIDLDLPDLEDLPKFNIAS